VSSATAPSSGNKAASGKAAPKGAPFQTVVKDSEDMRKAKTDTDKAPR